VSDIFDMWSEMISVSNGASDWFVPEDISLNDGGESAYNVFKQASGKTPAEVLQERRASDGKMITAQLKSAYSLAMYRAFLLRNLTPSRAFIISSNLSTRLPMFTKTIVDDFAVEGRESTR